jgi:hypothetical protein
MLRLGETVFGSLQGTLRCGFAERLVQSKAGAIFVCDGSRRGRRRSISSRALSAIFMKPTICARQLGCDLPR